MPVQELPEHLVGEEVRLKQILINLIKNALKFTKKGWIKIIVAYDYNEKMLKVHIFDSGKGIKQEELNKLFTKFGKLRRTAEMNSEGIGLGLMICKELVSKNQGTIEVNSEGENLGSVFTFTMKMFTIQQNDSLISSSVDANQTMYNANILLQNSSFID